jgi:beta-N-acetylhexosaminidase
VIEASPVTARASKSLEALASRRLVVGFDGVASSPALDELLRRGVGGVILFRRNVASPVELAELVCDVKRRAGRPLLVGVDQEGGRVARLRDGFTALPSLRTVGLAGDAGLARALGKLIGTELRAVGVDLDFAPVLDVDTNPQNPVIGDRSFGRDPARVAELGAAMLRGLQEAGIAACGKHFPGHGDTRQDSHHDLPRVPHALARMEAVELVPFAAAVKAGVASLMTAHVVFDAVDAAHPATLSEAVLGGFLRDRLGYDGVVFSDDLEMGAITRHFGCAKAAVMALRAGVDQLLVCHSSHVAHAIIDALAAAAGADAELRRRLEASEARFDRLVAAYARGPLVRRDLSVLENPAHRAVVASIAARAGDVEAGGRDPTSRGEG